MRLLVRRSSLEAVFVLSFSYLYVVSPSLTSVKDRLQDPMKSPLSSLIILIAFVSLSKTTKDSVV